MISLYNEAMNYKNIVNLMDRFNVLDTKAVKSQDKTLNNLLKLIESPDSNMLSQAALEVLAIIAYNSPITRIDVDEIRGVSSSQMIRKLVAKGLVKEVEV